MAENKYLGSVSEDKAFNLTDGKIVRSLDELYSMMNDSGLEVFYTHVNDVNNDVATWTRNNLGYNELADKMALITDRDEFLKLLGDSINDLKNPKLETVISPVISIPQNISSNIINVSAPYADNSLNPALAAIPQSTSQVSNSQLIAQPVIQSIMPQVEVSRATSPSGSVAISSPVSAVVIASETVTVNSSPVAQTIHLDSNTSSNATLTSNNASISNNIPNILPVSDPKMDSFSAVMSFMNEERFDFEDIFNMLLYELEQEVLVLDS